MNADLRLEPLSSLFSFECNAGMEGNQLNDVQTSMQRRFVACRACSFCEMGLFGFFLSSILSFSSLSLSIPPNHHPLSEKQVDSEKLSQMYDDPNGSLFICILFHNSEF